MRIPVTIRFAGLTQDVVIDGDPSARVEQLCTELARALAVGTPLTLSGPDGNLASSQTLSAAGVRAGGVLTLARTATTPTVATATGPAATGGGQREVRVLAGPDSGLVVALPQTGTLTVGRSADNDIPLSGARVSRRHASLMCRPDWVEVVDTGSANGIRVNGTLVHASTVLPPGALLEIDSDVLTVVTVDPADAARAALHPMPDGSLRLVAATRAPAVAEPDPDPVQVVRTALLPGPRLWERRPGRAGFLRLGISAPTPGTGVPGDVTVDLAASGVVAVTGDPAAARALARWLVLQSVVQTGPADLGLVVLAAKEDSDTGRSWEWVRWLPHCRPVDGPLALVGTDEPSTKQRISELVATIDARHADVDSLATPRYRRWMVVLDGVDAPQMSQLEDIAERGPAAGVHVLALHQVPTACPVVLTVTVDQRATLEQAGAAAIHLQARQTSTQVAERVARALAPLRDRQVSAAASTLPDEVALLDLLPGIGDPPALATQWRSRPRQSRILLGSAATGPVHADLVADGPHLLLAGTTGSGMSSLLLTIVGGLAAGNRPDELAILLLDGAAGTFAPLAHLPHVLGRVATAADAELSQLLHGLTALLARRQAILQIAGVALFEQYHQISAAGKLPPGCPARLPRLVVVVDRLEQWGDQVAGQLLDVVRGAQRLGLHLVVGTATPRAAVLADLVTVTTTRVALRMPAEDSRAVLGFPDAEQISQPGRGYLRRAAAVGFTPFQAAYLGGQSARATTAPPLRVLRAPWHALGYPPPPRPREPVADVVILAETIASATEGAGLPAQTRLL